ncbi:MAG: hypothetical protein ABI321_00770 [Polyangia bacterium]
MLKNIAVVLGTLASGGLAHAATTTHRINIAPVRNFIQHNVLDQKSGKLKVTSKLDYTKPSAGISLVAAKKAQQTLVGLEGFNSGAKGATYVRKMGNEKLLITRVTAHDHGDYNTMIQRFVVRSDKQGLVMARGYVKGGNITWTRMHNEHAATTPAETNAAK